MLAGSAQSGIRGRNIGRNESIGVTFEFVRHVQIFDLKELPKVICSVQDIPESALEADESDNQIRLRWHDAKPDRLTLIDAETKPRHLPLREAARVQLHVLAEAASRERIVPGGKRDELHLSLKRTSDAAGIDAAPELPAILDCLVAHVQRDRNPDRIGSGLP